MQRQVLLPLDDSKMFKMLIHAIEEECVELVKSLIEQGVDVHTKVGRDWRDWNQLHSAVCFNANCEIWEYLISKGFNFNAEDDIGEMLLYGVHTRQGIPDIGIVKILVSLGVDVNTKDEKGITPLYRYAAYDSSDEVVEYLISQGADVNAKDEEGDTPLHKAAYFQNADTVKCLVLNGADVHAVNKNGRIPLHEAAFRGYRVETLEHLVSNGADVNAKTDSGSTPLHEAARCCVLFVALEYLVSKGADVNAKDNNGDTALDVALRQNDFNDPDRIEQKRKAVELLERAMAISEK
jgi:ankyrin repeat protein